MYICTYTVDKFVDETKTGGILRYWDITNLDNKLCLKPSVYIFILECDLSNIISERVTRNSEILEQYITHINEYII